MKKTVLITGSTDGIGKLTALRLAQDGHRVLVHGRRQEKLARTISEIKKAAKNEGIDGFVADLSELDSVMRMAGEIRAKVQKIDVLINNAGVYNSQLSKNQNGLDIRFVVNYLAPYVLTHELIPLMKSSEDARIINLSSAAQASVSLDALKGESDLSQGEAYAQSKLALTMWSFKLAGEIQDAGVIAVNPGSLLNTKMVKEAFGNHWSPAGKGADILYELAVSDRYNKISGKYFDNDRGGFGNAHPDAYNENLILRLIESTRQIVA